MPLKDSPQYNKQHAVPQNIMDVEFKLIGDLTMRQFFYVLIFFGLAYGTFNTGIPLLFKWPLIAGFVLLGLGFAFVPVEDRGLDEWVVNFFKSVFSDSQLIWKKEPTPPSAFLYENLSAIQHELITLTPTASRRKLEQYLEGQYAQSSADPYDQLEQSYVMKVRKAFAGVSVASYSTPAPTTVTFEPDIQELPQPIAPAAPVGTTQQPKVPTQEEPKPAAPQPAKPKAQRKQRVRIPASEDIVVEPITPDRHAGRRFTSLLPNQGTIVLPIRGERVLKTAPETKSIDNDAATKAKQLQTYIEQIRGTEQTTRRTEDSRISEEAEALIQKLQKQNDELQKQIDALQTQPAKEIEIAELKQQQKETVETIGKLKEQVSSLTLDMPSAKLGEIPENLQPTIPNTVSGIVRNIQARGLDGVLLVIKNSKGEPVRAIKTNDLGEFSISNPLTNGHYTVEADVNGSTGFRFGIIEFEAKGEIIPAMEIVGK